MKFRLQIFIFIILMLILPFLSCGAPAPENDNHQKKMQQLVANYLATNQAKPMLFIYPNDSFGSVSVNSDIELYFSESVNIHAGWSVVVDGITYNKDSVVKAWYNNNEILVINPVLSFPRGKMIQITATGFVSAYRSATFDETNVKFYTGGTLPDISMKSPLPAYNVPSNVKFILQFSEKPQQTNDWVIMIDGVAYNKSYEHIIWSENGRELTINPMTTYQRGASFSFNANSFIAESDGYKFASYANSITIADAPKAYFKPANNESAISVLDPIVITFSEAMVPDCAWTVSINNVIYTATYPAISWLDNNRILTIQPNSALKPTSTIPVVINGFRAKFDNAPLSGTNQISFTTGCFAEVLKTNVGAHGAMKLLIGSNNAMHICYHDTYINKCVYGTNKSGEWQFETFNEDGSPYIAMILDAEENPHIFFEFSHFFKEDGVWQSEAFGTGFTSLFVSAAKDSTGAFHVVYVNETTLVYTTNKNGSWNQTVLETGNYSNYSSSMAVDGQGYVHVSYRNQPSIGNLMYATNSSGAWQKIIVDSDQQTAYDTSLALDTNGKVHIAYYSSPFHGDPIIKYATNISGSWIIKDIVSEPYDNPPTLFIDNSNHQYISIVNRIDDDYLQIFTNKTGTWKYTLVDRASLFDSKSSSMAMDSNGRLHVIYTVWTDYTLRHAYY